MSTTESGRLLAIAKSLFPATPSMTIQAPAEREQAIATFMRKSLIPFLAVMAESDQASAPEVAKQEKKLLNTIQANMWFPEWVEDFAALDDVYEGHASLINYLGDYLRRVEEWIDTAKRMGRRDERIHNDTVQVFKATQPASELRTDLDQPSPDMRLVKLEDRVTVLEQNYLNHHHGRPAV